MIILSFYAREGLFKDPPAEDEAMQLQYIKFCTSGFVNLASKHRGEKLCIGQ